MSGFPKLPLVHGDTDDDISIHLRRQIGPAVPLREKKGARDEEIMQILNESKSNSYSTDFNRYFKAFKETGRVPGHISESDESDIESEGDESVIEDEISGQKNGVAYNGIGNYVDRPDTPHEFSDDEGTYVRTSDKEDEPREAANKGLFEQFRKLKEESVGDELSQTYKPLLKKALYSFFISFTLTLLALLSYVVYKGSSGRSTGRDISSPFRPETYDDLVSEVQVIKTNLNQLDHTVESLAARQDNLQKDHESFSANIVKKLETQDQRFNQVSKDLNQNRHLENLRKDFEAIKKQVDNLQLETNPGPKIEEISEKLERLSNVNDEISSIKKSILNDLLNSLPDHVPVFIRNNKIHFVPEFHKYLYNFVENFNKERGTIVSWDSFIQENEPKLKEFFTSAFNKSSSNVRPLNKEVLENALTRKFNENNKMMWQKFNNLVDNLNLLNSSSADNTKKFGTYANEILLNNMLEIFAKGSIKVNYADYNLGSRILGFLTSAGPKDDKSLARRVFLGWYDYFSGNGLTSPTKWKYNANNLLLDNQDTWECQNDKCGIGIRLFNSVILTDLVLKSGNDEASENPTMASIYIKPKSFSQYNELIKHLNNFKHHFSSVAEGKYLKKFVKVKEVSFDSDKAVYHIKLPLSLINMRIPVKDVYIEFSSLEGKVALSNIKAYGISELNAYKYNEEFSLILDKIYEEESTLNDQSHFEYYDQRNDGHGVDEVLGDDEMLIQL